jgi:hypothetical protein
VAGWEAGSLLIAEPVGRLVIRARINRLDPVIYKNIKASTGGIFHLKSMILL